MITSSLTSEPTLYLLLLTHWLAGGIAVLFAWYKGRSLRLVQKNNLLNRLKAERLMKAILL